MRVGQLRFRVSGPSRPTSSQDLRSFKGCKLALLLSIAFARSPFEFFILLSCLHHLILHFQVVVENILEFEKPMRLGLRLHVSTAEEEDFSETARSVARVLIPFCGALSQLWLLDPVKPACDRRWPLRK